MAERWQIFSGDKTLGPWSSQQVREELRAGRIDPFDMVAKEGSSIKRPLVEVDEIFQNSRVQMGEMIPVPAVSGDVGFTKDVAHKTKVSAVPAEVKSEKPVEQPTPGADLKRPKQFQALAAADRVSIGVGQSSGLKKYRVLDSNGRSHGPHSSSDIINMWNSGSIDSRAIVQKTGSSKIMPIQKFLTLYQESKTSSIAFLSSFPTQIPSFKFVGKSRNDRLLFWIGILAMLSALAFLGKIYLRTKARESNKLESLSRLPKQRFDLNATRDLAGRLAPPPAPKIEKIEVRATLEGRKNLDRPESLKTPKSKQGIDKYSVSKRNKNATKSPRRSVRSGTNQKSSYSAPRIQNYTPPKRTPIYTNRLDKAVSPRAKSAIVASAQKQNQVRFIEGKTTVISGYYFNPAAFTACQGKCKIVMNGPQGLITVVFFKEAFSGVFSKKSKSLSLTGIVRKNGTSGWQLILSDAR